VIEDMLVLDSRRQGEEGGNGGTYEEAAPMEVTPVAAAATAPVDASVPAVTATPVTVKPAVKTVKTKKEETAEEVANDIPF